MNRAEAKEQARVIRWWSDAHRRLGVTWEKALIHIPNAGKRGKVGGRLMKAQGLRAGAPDLLLLVARHGWHGFAIELKASVGRRSLAQTLFLKLMAVEGFAVATCYSFEAVIFLLEDYLTTGQAVKTLMAA